MNDINHVKFGMGASVLRKEDDAFITGRGCYTDDKFTDEILYGFGTAFSGSARQVQDT